MRSRAPPGPPRPLARPRPASLTVAAAHWLPGGPGAAWLRSEPMRTALAPKAASGRWVRSTSNPGLLVTPSGGRGRGVASVLFSAARAPWGPTLSASVVRSASEPVSAVLA